MKSKNELLLILSLKVQSNLISFNIKGMKICCSKFKLLKTLAIIADVFFILSCQKYEKINPANYYSRSDVTATEAAFSAINSSLMETESQFLNATCNTTATYRTCAPYQATDYRATFNWNSCTFDHSKISFTGTWLSYYYNDGTMSCPQPITPGKETSRLTDSAPVKYTMINSDTVEMFTLQNPAFSGQAMGAYGIKTLQFDANTRKLRIDSMEVKRTSKGTMAYDVYLHSSSVDGTTQLTATGKLSTANRTLNGFTHVYFEKEQRIKVNFNSVLWTDATCCYPKSGNLLLQFDRYDAAAPSSWPSTGKTALISFTNTCGEAIVTGTDGISSGYTFSECF